MLKSIKIFSIILIIFSILINFYGVFATDIDMNLPSAQTNEVEENTEDIANTDYPISDDTTQADSVLGESDFISPSSVGTLTEEGLSTSNILSILLITVGIVLILLAIAIIIRLK